MNLTQKLFRFVPVYVITFISRNQWRHPVLRKFCKFGADLLRNSDGAIQNGVGKGLFFNPGTSHSGFILGTHKPQVQNLFATLLRPGLVMIDAGANAGFYAVIAAQLVGGTGTVICFEPLAENANLIRHNAALNNFQQIKVREEALGGEDGHAVFLKSAEPTWGKLRSVGKPPGQYTGEIEVPVRRLDSVIEETGLPNPDLIKIDVEGAEEDVLNGADRTIASCRPVLILELHGTNKPIASALETMKYEAVVLGHETSIVDSPWNSLIIAVPRERTDLIARVREALAMPVVGV